MFPTTKRKGHLSNVIKVLIITTMAIKIYVYQMNMLYTLNLASLVAQMEEHSCNAGDLGSIPGLGRSPGEGNSNPLQYSCLENSTDRGTWWATVCGMAKRWARLSD